MLIDGREWDGGGQLTRRSHYHHRTGGGASVLQGSVIISDSSTFLGSKFVDFEVMNGLTFKPRERWW